MLPLLVTARRNCSAVPRADVTGTGVVVGSAVLAPAAALPVVRVLVAAPVVEELTARAARTVAPLVGVAAIVTALVAALVAALVEAVVTRVVLAVVAMDWVVDWGVSGVRATVVCRPIASGVGVDGEVGVPTIVGNACVATCARSLVVGDATDDGEVDGEADGELAGGAVVVCLLPPHAVRISSESSTSEAVIDRKREV
jgi:hypothetical protein